MRSSTSCRYAKGMHGIAGTTLAHPAARPTAQVVTDAAAQLHAERVHFNEPYAALEARLRQLEQWLREQQRVQGRYEVAERDYQEKRAAYLRVKEHMRVVGLVCQVRPSMQASSPVRRGEGPLVTRARGMFVPVPRSWRTRW
jgi:hypothetical protein